MSEAPSARDQLRRRFSVGPPCVYGLLDTSLVPLEAMPDEAAALVEAGVEILQIRAKGAGAGVLRDTVAAVGAVLRATGVPLILNDRVDVARVAGGDGVHVGRSDLPAALSRELLGSASIVGVTAHSLEELAGVDPEVVDYVGYGAVFETSTREAAGVCGPEALTAAAAASKVPLVAIGGITPENVDALRGAKIAAVAVAASISPRRTCPGAVERLRDALAGW